MRRSGRAKTLADGYPSDAGWCPGIIQPPILNLLMAILTDFGIHDWGFQSMDDANAVFHIDSSAEMLTHWAAQDL